MEEPSVQIFRVDRCFKSYGVRPFVLVTSIQYKDDYQMMLCANYLILHENGSMSRKLGRRANGLPNSVSPDKRSNFVEAAAIDDALDALNHDLGDGSMAVSREAVSEVTLDTLLSARMRGAIAELDIGENDFLYPFADVIAELKAVGEFIRAGK